MASGIELYVPEDLRNLYQIHEYHHAAALLYSEFSELYGELCDALKAFRLNEQQLVEDGRNRREISTLFSRLLRPIGWLESKYNVSLVVDGEELRQDTYKIEYVKGRVACDLEWNSSNRTFYKHFHTIRTLFDYDRINVCVLVIHSERLNSVLRELNIIQKTDSSTAYSGKLLPRGNASLGGGCPVLIFGIS